MMPTPFRDLPIQRKLLLMMLASTGAALVLSSAGFLIWDIVQYRQSLERDIRAQAVILTENAGAPLMFNDDRVGREILAPLRFRPLVELACLYDLAGAVFSSYAQDATSAIGCPERAPDVTRFGWQWLEMVEPVMVEGRRVGTLYVRRGLADIYARLRVGLLTVTVLLAIAIAAAVLTGIRMQRLIAAPLLDLAETARSISQTHDYSLRAEPASKDEIGVVVRAFNEMLDRIGDALGRERAANRVKDEFLATLSHELRTPLSAVLGWTRMLRSGRLDSSLQARALETIERNARAQTRLVEDLLDMSRIVSGKPRFQIHEADLAGIIEAAVEVIRPAAAAKRLRLYVELGGAGPALTHGDPGRLQQIVWNLLSNAVKFTPSDGEIRVRLHRGEAYRFSVSDTGLGIDSDFLPHLFQPFRQADSSTTRAYGGLGLGLAIVKQLVELHGGTIDVHSDGLGKGATFVVTLPSVIRPSDRSEGVGQTPVEVMPAATVDSSLLRGLRVLVVDDEPDARLLLETTLKQYGAEVTTASSADQAFREIDHRPPDVLVSDLGMPDENGTSLIQRLRSRPAAQGGAIPAMAVTAYASVKDGLAAEAAGFQAHIPKPFEPAEVANLVALLGQPTGSNRS